MRTCAGVLLYLWAMAASLGSSSNFGSSGLPHGLCVCVRRGYKWLIYSLSFFIILLVQFWNTLLLKLPQRKRYRGWGRFTPVWRAEGTVGSDVDVLTPAVVNQLPLVQVRLAFHLTNGVSTLYYCIPL